MKLPIVYTEDYDVGISHGEHAHPVDTKRYGKTFLYLQQELQISRHDIYEAYYASDEELLRVHTRSYLDLLKNSETIARIAEFKFLSSIPNEVLQEKVLKSIRYAVGGTVHGSQIAMEHGWAINLSGGYHHAKSDSGGGFCFFSDIGVAIRRLQSTRERMIILIVDLDAHQGNGYASILRDDEHVRILDVYNEDIYPHDEEAKQFIDFHYPLSSYIDDTPYLRVVEQAVPAAIERAKPGIIFYIAGSDIFADDALGCMAVSETGIKRRDEIVFKHAFMHEIPILMMLGGGYTDASSRIMGGSIVHLIRNVAGGGLS